MNIFDFSNKFEYEHITLGNPQPVQGGSYFTKLKYKGDSLYVQLPKCNTKQGIIKTKKNKYCDLMYESNHEETLINWVEHLENKCQSLIDENKNVWFHTELTKDDISSMMTPICRVYKSGKNLLMRVFIEKDKYTNKDYCIAYNESEALVNLDDLENQQHIIPLLCIEGIKFTSRSFEIYISLKQIMVLNKVDDFINNNKCMIKKDTSLLNNEVSNLLEDTATINLGEKYSQLPGTEEATPADPLPTESKQAIPRQTEIKQDILAPDPEADDQEASTSPEADDQEASTSPEAPSPEVIEQSTYQQPLENTENIVNNNLSTTGNNLGRPPQHNNIISEAENIQEVELNVDDIDDSINLRKSDDVYNDIYKEAIRKAKKMRTSAVNAFLEAEKIKLKYNLQQIDEYSDSDESILEGSE